MNHEHDNIDPDGLGRDNLAELSTGEPQVDAAVARLAELDQDGAGS